MLPKARSAGFSFPGKRAALGRPFWSGTKTDPAASDATLRPPTLSAYSGHWSSCLAAGPRLLPSRDTYLPNYLAALGMPTLL